MKRSLKKYLIILIETSKIYDLKYLSLGMSNDYKLAIKYNSNMIRIGSLIFGSRN